MVSAEKAHPMELQGPSPADAFCHPADHLTLTRLCFVFDREMMFTPLWGEQNIAENYLGSFFLVSFSIILCTLTFHSNEILSTHVRAFRVAKPTM